MNLFQDPTWCSASDLRTAFGHGLVIPLLIAAAAWGLRRHLLRVRADDPPRDAPGGPGFVVGEVLAPSSGDVARDRFDLRLDSGEVIAVTHRGLLRHAVAVEGGHLTGDAAPPPGWPPVGARVAVGGLLSEGAEGGVRDATYRDGAVRTLRPLAKVVHVGTWPLPRSEDLRDARRLRHLIGVCLAVVVLLHAAVLWPFDRALVHGARAIGEVVEEAHTDWERRDAWNHPVEGSRFVKCTLRVGYREPDGTERVVSTDLRCPRAGTPARPVPLIVVPGAPQHTRPGNAVALDDGMVTTVHLCVWPIYLTLLVVALRRWSFRNHAKGATRG